jgi:hypothetical protein
MSNILQPISLDANLMKIDPSCSIKVSTEGIKILGAPVGTGDYIKRECDDIMENYSKIIPSVLDLKNIVSVRLLSQCINPRPVYIARTTDPEFNEDSLRIFTKRLEKSFNYVCQDFEANTLTNGKPKNIQDIDDLTVPRKLTKEILSLPKSFGGMGVTRRIRLFAYL